ncbi:hypothetical protein QBC41DRAFT_368630 [Cercophora samala]|uniref:Uncharacterized protein n=1 Tax=Cercophora samala TaxID=330535 RepID=A0AA40D545_9PEZI|nr:hypothetical protein QBC41DRAFT_368630 [Cercophora samala]
MATLLAAVNIQNHSSDTTALQPVRVHPPNAEPDAAQLKEKLANLDLEDDLSAAQPSAELEKPPRRNDEGSVYVLASGADSGYGSIAPSPQGIKDSILDRTSVPVTYQYNSSLWKAMSKGNKKAHPGDISMKLKYMGSDEGSAKLFIVVQCEKRVAKRVRSFFGQEHIQRDLKPDFEVHIIGTGVIRLKAEHTVEVFAEPAGRATFCGMRIHVMVEAAQAFATFGGLVTVTSGNVSEVFGLTASHPLEDITVRSQSDNEDSDSEEFTDTNSMSEIYESDTYPQPSHSPQLNAMTSIGDIAHDSLHSSSIGSANHDWALIRLDTPVTLPNFVPGSHLSSGRITKLLPGDSGSWVVNETTHEVYGHVISVDALGEAHVIPLESTLSDIRARLGADEVALTSAAYLSSPTSPFLPWDKGLRTKGKSAMAMGDYEGENEDLAKTQYTTACQGFTPILTQDQDRPGSSIRGIPTPSGHDLSTAQPNNPRTEASVQSLRRNARQRWSGFYHRLKGKLTRENKKLSKKNKKPENPDPLSRICMEFYAKLPVGGDSARVTSDSGYCSMNSSAATTPSAYFSGRYYTADPQEE